MNSAKTRHRADWQHSMLERGVRLALITALALVCTACVTLSDMAAGMRDALAPIPAQTDGEPAATNGSTSTAPSAASTLPTNAVRPANPNEAGSLHFILSDTGWGNYSGWRLQVLAARTTKGLNPLLSSPMVAGEHLKLSLWPDSYRVRVLLNDEVHNEMWVNVLPGQPTVIYVDIGLLSNHIVLLQGEEALHRIDKVAAPTRMLNLSQTFAPLPVALRGPTQGRWHGPRQNNQPIGTGRLDLYRDGHKIGSVDPAQADENGITGTPEFEDGRFVEGQWQLVGLADGSTTRYPDGKQFTGQYEGAEPASGELRLPDGRRWNGRVSDNEPAGPGQLTLPDGTVIQEAPGIDTKTLDGVYSCITPAGRNTECFWYEGQRLPSRAEYERRVAASQVTQARELSERATRTATRSGTDPMGMSGLQASIAALEKNNSDTTKKSPAVNSSGTAHTPVEAFNKPPRPAQPTTTEKPISGCTSVQGKFTTSTGLSRLSFDAGGRGSLWQQTYGGARTYTFDVDFRWKGSADGMHFDYGEAIYRDAGGREMQRRPLPSGSAKCSYNGRQLIIGGVSYTKQ